MWLTIYQVQPYDIYTCAKARTLMTIDAPAKHENGVSVFVPRLHTLCRWHVPERKMFFGLGNMGPWRKTKQRQGQWSQTELPSDEKEKKTLGLFAFRWMGVLHE